MEIPSTLAFLFQINSPPAVNCAIKVVEKHTKQQLISAIVRAALVCDAGRPSIEV